MDHHIEVDSLDDTDRLGRVVAAAITPPLTVGLRGTLGAGKTRFVQALAAAWGIPADTVVSPTFVLCQEYQGERKLYHFDAYRLRDEDEFLQLGPEECFEADAVTVIEWSDRVESCLPEDRLEIEIAVIDDSKREFACQATGPRSRECLLQVIKALS